MTNQPLIDKLNDCVTKKKDRTIYDYHYGALLLAAANALQALEGSSNMVFNDGVKVGVAQARQVVSEHTDWHVETVRDDLLLNIDMTCDG